MEDVLFSNLTPTRYLWVSPNGSNSNTGTENSPFKTIQAALDKAIPGTAVMVKAGEYHENVKFTKSGTPDAPIWLTSADGQGEAKVYAVDQSNSTIKGLGTDNVVVQGFWVDGGDQRNGIQFSQSGGDFSNLVKNIVIRDNIVHDSGQDSIKVSQGEHVWVVNNHTVDADDQGVDYVSVNDSVIAYNEIEGVTSDNALTVKGGSTNVLVEGNLVHNVLREAIKIGGWTGEQYMRPGFDTYEAKNVTVIGNEVYDVGKRALMTLGAQDVVMTNNFLHDNETGVLVDLVSADIHDPPMNSKNVTIKDNVLDKSAWLHVQSGQGVGLVNVGNRTDGVWSGKAGAILPVDPPGPGGGGSPDPDPTPTPTPPTLTIGDASVTEGQDGSKMATFQVSLSKAATAPVTVAIATQDGTATAGSDYDGVSDTLTFAPGETAKTLSVAILGDATVEPDEAFKVTLSNPQGATIAKGEATGTITNDDAATVPQTGSIELLVTASGAPAADIFPHFKLMVDGAVIGDAFAKTGVPNTYAFKADMATDQGHHVQVFYDNDTVLNGEDRNLFIHNLTINGHVIAPNDPMVSYDRNALDGQNVTPGQSAMYWWGALDFNVAKEYFSGMCPATGTGGGGGGGAAPYMAHTEHQTLDTHHDVSIGHMDFA